MNMLKYIKAIGRRIKWQFLKMIMYSMRIFPINSNKIMIVNYFGKGYGDNPKYICEELLKRTSQNINIIWALSDEKQLLPQGVSSVEYGSIKYYYDLCTAKIWIDNCRKEIYIRKRKEQYYIQTWHGDIAIKQIEGDAINSLSPSYVQSAKNDSKMADLFVTGNEWMTTIYRNSMWYNGKILKCGYPRRDILFNISHSAIDRIKENLGIDTNKKIVIYAPTFRKKQNNPDLSVYNLDYKRLISALKTRFGGDWIILIRLHPNIAQYSSRLIYSSNVIDVSKYPDMQELMAISNICISDYSSSILEFASTGKPGFIFAVDYDDYIRDRNTYFKLSELPFPISMNNDQLVQTILEFDKEKYKALCKQFYLERIKIIPNGDSSKQIVDIILKKINA